MMLFSLGLAAWFACAVALTALIVTVSFAAVFLGLSPRVA
jgi:hypothetical protein